MHQVAIELFVQLAVPAGEIAFTFAFGTYLIRTFLEMALGRGIFKL